MSDADLKIKQQIVDKIKSSTNILVTVSKNPSVDDLSAALGLATILNKIDKHATAIFSGSIPPAITFLNPDKVFEDSADSLRDFIIALDKEKADHLRYKVEGDVVKIFITPYRTTISADDLEFSQGDYNVELVLALGVDNQEHLDASLEAHGRILHDVTVATFSSGGQTSQLGSLDWHDETASSLSEMVANIADSLKGDKTLLDKQIATALLTGIVAATDRFSNTRTSAKVMTLAADLMAAGADQQLIAAKLQESHTINAIPPVVNHNETETTTPTVSDTPASENIVEQSTLPPDNLSIPHQENTETVDTSVDAMDATISTLPPQPPAQSSNFSMPNMPQTYPPEPSFDSVVSTLSPNKVVEPLLGGVLNATTDQAEEDARRELEENQNKTILTHSYLGGSEPTDHNSSVNSAGSLGDTQNVDIFAGGLSSTLPPTPDLPMPPPPVIAPLSDFSTLPPPPLPDFNAIASDMDVNSTLPPTSPPNVNDPSQFRIPGQ